MESKPRKFVGGASVAILSGVAGTVIAKDAIPLWAWVAIGVVLGLWYYLWEKRRLIWLLLLAVAIIGVWLRLPDYREWELGMIGVSLLTYLSWRLGRISTKAGEGSPGALLSFPGWVSEAAVIEHIQRLLLSRGHKFEDSKGIRGRISELIRAGAIRARQYDYQEMDFKPLDASNVEKSYPLTGRAGVEFWSEDVDRIDIER